LAILPQMPIEHRVVDPFPGNAWAIDFRVGSHSDHHEHDRKMVKTKTRSIDKWSDFLSLVFFRFARSFLCSALLSRLQLDFLYKKYDCFKQTFELSFR